jgi:hypothetical protein
MEKKFELTNDCGVTLRGDFKSPSNVKERVPVVIMASGYGGSGSLSRTWVAFEKKFLEEGIGTFLFDYTGQGNSEGNIRDLVPFLAVSELRMFIKEMKKITSIDESRIALLGSSFGGLVSLIYCANYNDIKILGLKSPVSDYAQVREIQLGESGIEKWRDDGVIVLDGTESSYDFYVQNKSIDVYDKLAEHIEIPCLIVHGGADTNVPVTQSKALHEKLPNSALKIVPGANHGYKEGDSFEVMVNTLVDWFSTKL